MKRRVIFAAVLLLSLLAFAPDDARSQAGPVQAFQTTGRVSLSVSGSTNSIALATNTTSSPPSQSALIRNTGTADAYFVFGDSSVAATTSSPGLVRAGEAVDANFGNSTYIAAITATGSTTLAIQTGVGTPFVAVPGSGGAGGTVTANQGSAGASPWPVSVAGFTPNGSYGTPLSATNSSSQTALPTGASVLVQNAGSVTAYVNLGTSSSVTATTSQIAVPAGGGCVLTLGSNTNLAAITATGSTTINLSGGAGLGSACYGGGSGSGGATAVTHAQSSALAANLTAKGSAGSLYSFEVAADSTLAAAAWWIMVYDATGAPADGAITPAKCYALPSGSTGFNGAFPNPIALTTGIVIGVSTNGCFTKAASTHAFIGADYQ